MNGMIKELKKWEEQTEVEKLNTLREEIRMNRYVNDRVYKLEEQLRLMKEHAHVDGKVMMPVLSIRDNGYQSNLAGTIDRLS